MSAIPRWIGSTWRVWASVALVIVSPSAVRAQTTSEPRLALAIGPQWLGGADVGGRDAVLTRNPTGVTRLFDTQSTLTGGMGISGSLGVRLRGHWWVEAIGRYHSARLSTRVTGDVEARDQAAEEAVQHLVIEGGAFWMPPFWRVGDRLQFYAGGGVGHLRQLHSTGTLAETGRSYHAGGGVMLALPQRPNGTFKASAVRVEARAAALDGGVAFDDHLHVAPAVWVALWLRF